MALLVSKTEIAAKRPISKSVADAKINPFIEDAQQLDLLPLLGEKLFFDLFKNPSVYTDLMAEKEYVYDDNTITSPGLKTVLIDFAYARYVMHGSQTDTPFGLVQKDYEGSTPVSRTDKKEGYKFHQQTAMQYWAQVELYLLRNRDTYPLFRADMCSSRRKTFKLNHITR